MGKIVQVFGYVLLLVGVAFLTISMALTLYYDGWWKFTEIMSPFNVWQYVFMLIVLAPGAALVRLGNWIAERRGSGSSQG